MGFEPTIKTETFGGSDKSWIRVARFGTETMLPIMLDMSTFSTNHVVNGKIPSGICLGKIGAGPFYGPYAGSVVESDSIAIDATAGTWTVTFQGQVSGAVAFNVSAANLQAEIEKLDDINVGDVVVTGGPGASGGLTPYVIAFTAAGQYGHGNAPNFTAQDVSLTGGGDAATVTVTAGGSAASDGREVFAGHLFEDVAVPHIPGQTPDLTTCADVAAAIYWRGLVVEAKLPTFGGTNGGVIDAAGKASVPTLKYV